MAKNRYVKDYRLVETIDERGRIRTDYEYIGAAYRFLGQSEKDGKTRRLLLPLCLIGWLLFIGAMLPNSAGMRTLYVALPFAFTALPLAGLTELALVLRSAKEPMEHRTADRLENGFPPRAIALAVLPGLSLLGELVNLFRPGVSLRGGDGVLALCAALLACCGVLCFRRRASVRAGQSSAY